MPLVRLVARVSAPVCKSVRVCVCVLVSTAHAAHHLSLSRARASNLGQFVPAALPTRDAPQTSSSNQYSHPVAQPPRLGRTTQTHRARAPRPVTLALARS